MFPLTYFSVLWPPYVTAPQTILETSLFLGGQTRYGASFSSSRLQQYILESLLITTEHSSEKLKFFQIYNAQFLRAFAHLIRNGSHTELRNARNIEVHGTLKRTELRKNLRSPYVSCYT